MWNNGETGRHGRTHESVGSPPRPIVARRKSRAPKPTLDSDQSIRQQETENGAKTTTRILDGRSFLCKPYVTA
jgi:hypothetical protein